TSTVDYADFEYLLNEIRETYGMRILAYVIMPNHWHLVLYPRHDGDLGKALHWLTTAHVRRHHTRHGTIGHGHLYQGTYKSFLVETDHHYLTVLKYVERNAVRARLSKTAESWRWGSAYRRINGSPAEHTLLADSPVPLPRNYRSWINDPEPAELLKDVRVSVEKGVPYGTVLIPNTIIQQ
ncbi:MAG: transposase, partial [Candidatus Paceibacteria bacterium]